MTKNWEQHKDRMYDLYMMRGMKLADLQSIMAQHYGFQASERAYKQKFKEWQWFKKTPRNSRHLDVNYSDADFYASGSDDGYDPIGTYSHHQSPLPTPTSYPPSTPSYLTHSLDIPSSSGYMDAPQFTYTHPGGATSLGLPVMGYGGSAAGRPVADPVQVQQQKEVFRNTVAQAEVMVEMGQYAEAGEMMDSAKRTLEWLRQYGGP